MPVHDVHSFAPPSSPPATCVEVGQSGTGRVSRTLRAPCTLCIGSSSACDLRVVARGVRARHLVLQWDGASLTLLGVPGSGPVRIEGRIVRPPYVVSGPVVLAMGEAEVRVFASPSFGDEPTAITQRPPIPADATTTQRVRHHRSRLDPVCVPVDAVGGEISRRVKTLLESNGRGRSIAIAVGLVLAVAVVLLLRIA